MSLLKTAGRAILKFGLNMVKARDRLLWGLKRISKPGLRVYANCDELPEF